MTLKADLMQTREGAIAWYQEEAVLEVNETICRLMDKKKMTRAELAKAIKMQPNQFDRFLNGEEILDVRAIAEVLFHLGYKFRMSPLPIHPVPSKEKQ